MNILLGEVMRGYPYPDSPLSKAAKRVFAVLERANTLYNLTANTGRGVLISTKISPKGGRKR